MRQCGQKRRAEGPPPGAAEAPSEGAAAPVYVTAAPVWASSAMQAGTAPMEGAEAAVVGDVPPATPHPLQVRCRRARQLQSSCQLES